MSPHSHSTKRFQIGLKIIIILAFGAFIFFIDSSFGQLIRPLPALTYDSGNVESTTIRALDEGSSYNTVILGMLFHIDGRSLFYIFGL